MGEVSTLSLIKSVLLAPLSKARVASILSEFPSGHASSAVSLHDNHNIEIKTITELRSTKSVVETDLYLFVPKNFELRSFGKDALITDFRSRVRLALPVSDDQGSAALEEALTDLENEIKALLVDGPANQPEDINHALYEPLIEAAKDVSAVIAEKLKHSTSDHTRKFLLSHSLMTISQSAINGLKELSENIQNTARMMESVRSVFDFKNEATASILLLLDEYLSQLYIQYLGSIRSELDRMPVPKSAQNDLTYTKTRAKLEQLLDTLQKKEAEHRLRHGFLIQEEETELEREQRLVRLSQLKKFFQSTTFIDINRQQSSKKISESTATIGTAVAAIIAATIEQFARGHASADYAWQGLSLLSLGVIVYVLRDRMKDWAKKKFHQKALAFLPDFEQKLIAKNRKIGVVKEWFQLLSSKNVPLDILALRRTASLTEMEKRLPEDVFHCRKIQEVDASRIPDSSRLSYSRALFESTRVNFYRYLRHMDDAFKEFTDLDPKGRILSSRSHRVYYFYLCMKTTCGPADTRWFAKFRRKLQVPRQTQTLLYRIVVDKNGIVRVESLAS